LKFYFPEEGVKSIDLPNENMIVEALVTAFKLYNNPKAKVLFVVGTFEGNIFDQRFIELGLLDHGIHSVRADLTTIYDKVKFDEADGKLYLDNDEIGIVYFRSGYSPDQYPTQKEWKAREMIEMSRAIKCPNVDLQLIGFKKFQYFLCEDENLKKFIKDENDRNALRANFARFWSFDDHTKLDEIKEMVAIKLDGYVLKPQREGGGNNTYGIDILEALNKKSHEELKSFVLMQRIHPVAHMGFLMRNKVLEVAPVISELGVFGYMISDKEKIIKNETGGYLLRTKKSSSDEGGVAAGYGVIDSLAS